jgi:2,3-bisphosphoglycerate-dependent phosphoglycerate mutase
MNLHLSRPIVLRTNPGLISRWRARRLFIPEICLLCLSILLLIIVEHPAWGQSTGMLRIYLARHGETDWNVERRLQGGIDTALNSTGRKQAAKLAEWLKGIRLDAVYSSTLSRSRDTAEIVRGDIPLKSLAGLSERRIGKFEGKKLDKISDPATALEYPKRSRDPDDELDGGESLNQFYERVRTTIEFIRSQHSSGAILIVAHAITNQMILRAIFNLTLQQAIFIRQANDELYLIEIDAGNAPRLWKLITEANLGDL